MYKKRYTPEAALPRIILFCDYQERSHQEVRDKLYGFGLNKSEVETIISRLIEDNHLNETRFAQTFVRGKFRIKQWGKIKIGYALKLRRISPYNIRKALDEIDAGDYQKTLLTLIGKKWRLLAKSDLPEIAVRSKLSAWLVGRGFEPLLIRKTLHDFFADQKILQSKN